LLRADLYDCGRVAIFLEHEKDDRHAECNLRRRRRK
jgi:hypothetical protein